MAGALGGDYERLQDAPYPFGWVKPAYILILFFLLSIMVYFDRGALAGMSTHFFFPRKKKIIFVRLH